MSHQTSTTQLRLGVFLSFISLVCVSVPYVSAHESEKPNTFVIHIDEEGFTPQVSTVPVGTEVIFENTGKEDHWPAGNDHPSHTMYDGTTLEQHCSAKVPSSFDACKPIQSGQSWSFIFSKEGTYKFHDHLWAQLTGTITVGTPQVQEEHANIFQRLLLYIKSIPATIVHFFTKHEDTLPKTRNTSSEFYTTLKDRFENIVTTSNPHEAIHELREESEKDPHVLALCHDVLHVIGHTAYDKYGSFKEAVQYQEDFCNSGYIHGLFESYFQSTKDPLVGLSDQCRDYGVGKRPFDIWQCNHGIGHGFMYLTGGDLDASLNLCKKGLRDQEAISSCQNGAYMEVFNLEILSKEKDAVNPNNPFLTCLTRSIGKEDCYVYIPTYLSQTLGMNFSDIFKECSKAEDRYQLSCIEGVGAEAIKRSMEKPSAVFDLCKEAGSSLYQEACISGAVKMYMNQEGSYTSGEELCKTVPASYATTCSHTVHVRESFFKNL